jgi:hypothetical protein
VYFATLGSHVYALEPDGRVCWTWDFVTEKLGLQGDRWSGRDWLQRKDARVTAAELFPCTRDVAVHGKTLAVPAGGYVVWLKDAGDKAEVETTIMPRNITLGLSLGEDGTVYRQWTLLDNGGQVDVLRPGEGGKVQTGAVGGTRTNTNSGLVSFASVSLRGNDIYRCKPEDGLGLCRHHVGTGEPEPLSSHPAWPHRSWSAIRPFTAVWTAACTSCRSQAGDSHGHSRPPSAGDHHTGGRRGRPSLLRLRRRLSIHPRPRRHGRTAHQRPSTHADSKPADQ